jgi:predicted anti-sigma-YlaC factor YlaD
MLGAVLTGCSIQRFVINKAGDALSGESTAVARDDDPDFVRAATPFSLKLIESLLEKSPAHEGMLLTAASGFTQYSYAFIQQDAERLEDQDFAGAQELRARAGRMYLRARDYGLRGLEVRHPGLSLQLQHAASAALQSMTIADVGLLYWTGAAWAAAIGQAKDNPALVGDLSIVDALVERAALLEPGYGHGALHSFQIGYEMARAARPEVAREHFSLAVVASRGRLAGPYVSLAESVCVPQRARAEFEALVTSALAIDADANKDSRLENLILQRRARWLLSRIDDLFLPVTNDSRNEEKP